MKRANTIPIPKANHLRDFDPAVNNVGIRLWTYKEDLNRLKKLLDYYVGIIGICLSHDDTEKHRRSNKKFQSPYTVIKDTTNNYNNNLTLPTVNQTNSNRYEIYYSGLSPFYLISPPLTSLILGLLRDVVDLSNHQYTNCNKYRLATKYLKAISHKKIKEIIDTVDYEKAKKLYYKYIRPISSYHPRITNTLRCQTIVPCTHLTILDDMIENGYQKHFKPSKLSTYWRKRGAKFWGFHSYCMDELNKG